MKPQTPPSELALAFDPLKPVLMRAAGFSMVISLLALSPTVYMLEVYDRVVNARSGMTLAMLTVVMNCHDTWRDMCHCMRMFVNLSLKQ